MLGSSSARLHRPSSGCNGGNGRRAPHTTRCGGLAWPQEEQRLRLWPQRQLLQQQQHVQQQWQQRRRRQRGGCCCAASGGDGGNNGADSDDGSSVSASRLRFNKDVPLRRHRPDNPEHVPPGELPEHLRDLELGADGMLIDGKTGRVVNGLGATRFDVALSALRGDLDPKPWEENTERAPGVLLGSLVTFPADYTFQVVGASEGGCAQGRHDDFVEDCVATVARICEAGPLPDAAVARKPRLGGRYVSLAVTVRVRAPEIVGRVYEELGRDPRVKMKF